MFYGLSKLLKNLLPKRLFYRGLLIVAIPILVLQVTITLVFFDINFFIELKVFGTTLQNSIFSIFLKSFVKILNFLFRIEFVINFEGKLIFFKILSLEFTKNNLVTEFPISPKISMSIFILFF